MADIDGNDAVDIEELKQKICKCNKNVASILLIVKNIEEKLNNNNINKGVNKENDKDRINRAFEKKQIGRPVGSWEEKRKQYFEWICKGKIT